VRLARTGISATVLLAVAACTGAKDPRQGNIFDIYAGVLGGGYDQRLREQEAQLAREQAARDQAAGRAGAAQQQADAARAERARLERDIAAQRAETERLSRDIAGSRDRTRVNQDRLAQLQRDITALQQEQQRLATRPDSTAQAEVEAARQRQAALQRQWDQLRQAAPRE
jgi:chromosome segregation ATPase